MTRKTSLITKILKPLFIHCNITKYGNFNSTKYANLENTYLTTKDNIKIGVWSFTAKEPIGCIIALHGTGTSRISFTEGFKITRFVNLGYHVVVPDYRGFGDSEGEFWVETIADDLKMVYDHCLHTFGMEPYILGYSMGGAVAIEFAHKYNFKNKLILLSTFASTNDILNDQKIWRIAKYIFKSAEMQIRSEFYFASDEKIVGLDKNQILLLHGEKDTIVDKKHSEKLALLSGGMLILSKKDTHSSIFFNVSIIREIDLFLRGEETKIKKS